MASTRADIREPASRTLASVAARHPEWPVALLAGLAWVGLAWVEWWSTPQGHHAHGAGLGFASLEAAAALALMPVAMMSPLILGALRHAALTTFWRRRQRAAGLFLAGYLAVWLAVGTLLTVAVATAAWLVDWRAATAGAFAAAVLWQFTPAKRRALRRCERRLTVPGDGWAADRACLANGVAAGVACAATCWALMAAALTAHHAAVVMLAVFSVQIHERRAWRFRPAPAAALIAALGIVSLAATLP